MNKESTSKELAEFTDQEYRVQASFRRALREFVLFSEDQSRKHGLTPQQHIALLSIRSDPTYPRVTVGQVAEAMQLRHHSASLLVDRCVKRELVHRQEDPDDRRRVMLSLTADGQHILDEITRANRRQLRSLDIDLFLRSVRETLDDDLGSEDNSGEAG